MKKYLVCFVMLVATSAAMADGHFLAALKTAFEESKGFPFRTAFPSRTEGLRKYHGQCFDKDDPKGFDRSMTVEVKPVSGGRGFFAEEERVLLNGKDVKLDIDSNTYSTQSTIFSNSLRVVERGKGKKYLLSRTTSKQLDYDVLCWYDATP